MPEKEKERLEQMIAGMAAIFVGLTGLLFVIRTPINYLVKASPQEPPRQVKLTNISENSVAVSWLTENPTKAFLQISESNSLSNKQVVLDDRSSQPTSKVHHLTLRYLTPGKTYYFLIGSGEETYDNNGSPYQFTAPATPQTTPLPPFVIKGKILGPDSLPAKEVLVYFSFANSTPISTLTDQNGNYLLNLNNCRKTDWSVAYPVQPKEKGYLLVYDGGSSLLKPVVIEDNQTIANFSLKKGVSAAEEKVEEQPSSLETNLPPAAEKKESLIARIINFFKKLFRVKNG